MVDIFDGAQYLAVDDDVFEQGRGGADSAECLDIHGEALLRNAAYHLGIGRDSAGWNPPTAGNNLKDSSATRVFAGKQWWTLFPPFPIYIAPGQKTIDIAGIYAAGGSSTQVDLVIPGIARRRFTLANTNIDWLDFHWSLSLPEREEGFWSYVQAFGRSEKVQNYGKAGEFGGFSYAHLLTKGADDWLPTASPPVDNDTQEIHATELSSGAHLFTIDHVYLWEHDPDSKLLMSVSPYSSALAAGNGYELREVVLSFVQLASVSVRPTWEIE